MIPHRPIKWREPWYQLEESNHYQSIQDELQLEAGPLHPLWNNDPVAIGQREDCDDIAVTLSGGRFAIVHLLWHGQIDQFPDRFPSTRLFDSLDPFSVRLMGMLLNWWRHAAELAIRE